MEKGSGILFTVLTNDGLTGQNKGTEAGGRRLPQLIKITTSG
jgi:hypothetical protein